MHTGAFYLQKNTEISAKRGVFIPNGVWKCALTIATRACLSLWERCPSSQTGAERVLRTKTNGTIPSQSKTGFDEPVFDSSPRGGAKTSVAVFLSNSNLFNGFYAIIISSNTQKTGTAVEAAVPVSCFMNTAHWMGRFFSSFSPEWARNLPRRACTGGR